MIEEKYLPLGTVVLLKEAKKRLMIIGYEAITDEEEKRKFDYVGCLYPEGIISPDKNLLFNHDQIETIYFRGFTDEEDRLFKIKLKEILSEKDSNNTPKKQDTQVEIPILHNEQIETLEHMNID